MLLQSTVTEEYSTLLSDLQLGHYVKVIQDDSNPVLSEEEEGSRQVCLFRALWALRKPRTIPLECPGWRLIEKRENLLVNETELSKDSSNGLVEEMKHLVDSALSCKDRGASAYSAVIAALTLYLLESRLSEAYALVQRVEFQQQISSENLSLSLLGLQSLELKGILVYIYLSLRRTDLALKVVSSMKNSNAEYTIPCLLSEIFTWIYCGIDTQLGTKQDFDISDSQRGKNTSGFQEALYIIQELMDTYGRSSMLYNLEAVCYSQMGHIDTAISCLEDAHRLSAEDAHVLANLVVVFSRFKSNMQEAKRYSDLLSRINKSHPYFADSAKKALLFDQLAEQYH
jgi:tetratricopeptide (TPR) repeat protein